MPLGLAVLQNRLMQTVKTWGGRGLLCSSAPEGRRWKSPFDWKLRRISDEYREHSLGGLKAPVREAVGSCAALWQPPASWRNRSFKLRLPCSPVELHVHRGKLQHFIWRSRTGQLTSVGIWAAANQLETLPGTRQILKTLNLWKSLKSSTSIIYAGEVCTTCMQEIIG